MDEASSLTHSLTHPPTGWQEAEELMDGWTRDRPSRVGTALPRVGGATVPLSLPTALQGRYEGRGARAYDQLVGSW